MWRRCVRTVFVDTNSSAAISGALRLLGRYRTTRSSASLSVLAAARARRSGCGEARRARRGSSASSAACAVRCRGMALEQLPDRREHERQDDPVRLGQLERALDRRLGAGPVAELVARRRVEQQRVDRRPVAAASAARRRRPLDHRRERSSAVLRSPSASASAAAAMRIPARSRSSAPTPASAARAAASRRPAAPARARSSARTSTAERVSPASSAAIRSARAEAVERLLEGGPARAAAGRARSGASARCSDSPSARGAALDPLQPPLGLVEATEPGERGGRPRRPPGRRSRCVPHPCASAIVTASSLSRSAVRDGRAAQRRPPARGGRGSRSPGTAGRCGGRARAPPRGRGAHRPGCERPQLGDAEVHQRGARDGRCRARSRLLGRSCASQRPHRLPARRRDHRAGTPATAARSPAAGRRAAGAPRAPRRPAARRRRCRRALSSSRPS